MKEGFSSWWLWYYCIKEESWWHNKKRKRSTSLEGKVRKVFCMCLLHLNEGITKMMRLKTFEEFFFSKILFEYKNTSFYQMIKIIPNFHSNSQFSIKASSQKHLSTFILSFRFKKCFFTIIIAIRKCERNKSTWKLKLSFCFPRADIETMKM